MSGAGGMTPYEESSLRILQEINEKLNRFSDVFIQQEKVQRKPNLWAEFTGRVVKLRPEDKKRLQTAAAMKDARPDDYLTMTDDEIRAFSLGGRRNTRKRRV
jgi:hypothetical protein